MIIVANARIIDRYYRENAYPEATGEAHHAAE
jgi:hypothetical protein